MDRITLYSSQVYLAEDNFNPDSYIAKFIICDFGRNKNGVSLNRDGIEDWLATLKNKPLVGKIKMKYDGTYDFTGHNMKLVNKVDEDGNKYQEVEFDTDAFGTFFFLSIETINDQEVIVASCEIWKRFTKACEIIVSRIKNGTLHTSWEIAIEKSHQGIVDGLMTKIIDVGRFIGHCLLGKQVSPAYDSSGLLEIASTNYDVEFAEALSQDIISQGLDINNQEKEEDILKKDENITLSNNENIEEVTTTEEASTEKNKDTETVKDGTKTEQSEDTSENKDDDDDEKNEDGECKKKKGCSAGECKKKKSSTSASTETSALTSYDLRRKLSEECRKKIDNWCYVTYLFPEEKEVWCEYDGDSELDYLKFTYTVENDEVTVSEPEKVTLTVSVKDINSTVSEYEKTIAEKDDLIVKASSEITSLKSENTELSQYKEKFTQMEQEKVDAELAQKKEDLIASVIKSGQITREEIEASEEFSGYVDNLDKKSIMAIIGERLSASVDSKTDDNVETSETKSDVHVASNLNNEDDEVVDKASIMRNFLRK